MIFWGFMVAALCLWRVVISVFQKHAQDETSKAVAREAQLSWYIVTFLGLFFAFFEAITVIVDTEPSHGFMDQIRTHEYATILKSILITAIGCVSIWHIFTGGSVIIGFGGRELIGKNPDSETVRQIWSRPLVRNKRLAALMTVFWLLCGLFGFWLNTRRVAHMEAANTRLLIEWVQAGEHGLLLTALKDGFDPNGVDKQGRTALHYAAERNDIMCALMLLSYGADSRIADDSGMTPEDVARTTGSWDVLNDMENYAKERHSGSPRSVMERLVRTKPR